MTDSELIKAAQGGDRSAFEQLLETEYDSIYRFARGWAGNREDAEDIAQQACIKLARVLDQFRFESAFSTWLYRLVINCAKDWQQSQQRHQRHRVQSEDSHRDLDLLPAHHASPETAVFLATVLVMVASMGEGFKEALLLVFGEGMNHREAAAVLQVKESTVSWRIHEIRKRLKQWHEGSQS